MESGACLGIGNAYHVEDCVTKAGKARLRFKVEVLIAFLRAGYESVRMK